MKQEGLLFFSDLHLTHIAFFIFFISFLTLVYKVFLKKNVDLYEELSQMPLQEENLK